MKKEKTYIFDNPKNITRLLRYLYIICVILFILDFFIGRHIYHPWENMWAFHAIYGFVACVILVLIAKWMRTFLMRNEDFYTKSENSNVDD